MGEASVPQPTRGLPATDTREEGADIASGSNGRNRKEIASPARTRAENSSPNPGLRTADGSPTARGYSGSELLSRLRARVKS